MEARARGRILRARAAWAGADVGRRGVWWLGEEDRTGARRGPLSPGPSPPRSGRKGRIRSRSERCRAPASAPTGSPGLATSPKTAGGGWGLPLGLRLGDIHRTAPAGGAPPRSFLAERGELDRAPKGVDASPAEAPHDPGVTFIPSPVCGRGCEPERAGEGPRGRSSIPPQRPERFGSPNLPQQFWGRWASHASPEGAPADAAGSRRSAPESSPPTGKPLPL
jgi:hypothetical protein